MSAAISRLKEGGTFFFFLGNVSVLIIVGIENLSSRKVVNLSCQFWLGMDSFLRECVLHYVYYMLRRLVNSE